MLQFAKLLIGPVSNWLAGRKESKDKALAAQQVWEASMGRSMENGWKDEYVTVVITWPIVQLFIGNLVFAMTGDERILLANQQSLQEIGLLMNTDYGALIMVVALAAVGIKGLKVLQR